jgi:hypothetical protein
VSMSYNAPRERSAEASIFLESILSGGNMQRPTA